ncbi:catalase [Campylobacter sp. 2014D-0216]|uniref:catalase n=1 Tax=Campylobacter sp. 2014D-0216 TaxID=1813595 RepID=UPI0018A4CE04|nr:catalase [Campylobacter sp. 2014D-0216]QOR01029.1 catalase [Campylobacter sp. 2014D-0216]
MKKYINTCLVACCLSGIVYANDVEYDAQKIADIFYQLNADPKNPKAKVNHAKGFCAMGSFEPAQSINREIDVPLLMQKKLPIQVRYSLGGAFKDDKSKTRGMAIRITSPKDSASWTMVMLNTEINFAKNPKEFGQFFEMRLPVNGRVDQEKISKMIQEVDSYRNFVAYTDKIGISKSVANTPFFSIHTFYFKQAGSEDYLPARWKLVPSEGVKYLNEMQIKNASSDFLKEDFQNRVKLNQPVEYKMYLVYANQDDITDETTALWSGKHKESLVGTFKVDALSDEDCNFDVFFPSDIPQGVNPPKDPLFDVRNEAYAITFGNRQ